MYFKYCATYDRSNPPFLLTNLFLQVESRWTVLCHDHGGQSIDLFNTLNETVGQQEDICTKYQVFTNFHQKLLHLLVIVSNIAFLLSSRVQVYCVVIRMT